MPSPRVLILRAPGTNCDLETAFAFEQAGATAVLLHINQLLRNPQQLSSYEILCLPGGFSYGDDIAAGRILANQIRHNFSAALRDFTDSEKLVLGICNGFQILLQTGLLPGNGGGPTASLTWNDSGKFEDRWVELAVCSERCVFLQGAPSMYLPVAHAEGKFVFRDAAAARQLQAGEQLVLRYASAAATEGQVPYPDNPNGSQENVAGICDPSGRILGLMPHPERHIDGTHHPRWTRGEAKQEGDGMQLFRNAVQFFS